MLRRVRLCAAIAEKISGCGEHARFTVCIDSEDCVWLYGREEYVALPTVRMMPRSFRASCRGSAQQG